MKKYLPSTKMFLRKVEAKTTPDGGTSSFWYDILGRLVASQNSEQLAPRNALNNSANRYSYTKYDDIGRITEVGEKYSGTVLLPQDDDVIPPGALNTKINNELNTWYASGTDKQVTATIYDQPNTSIVTNSTITSLQTTNSRKRVVTSYLKEQKSNPTYDVATHYVYDINGNVRTLFQENIALKTIEGGTAAGLRQINYDYDLISGKVNKVIYQPGKGDQFHYRYEYDADNRIKDAYSSRNGLQWQKDAHYYYYLHGPLARVELGKYQVQGVDYAYTLQGWLKGIKSQSLDVAKDMAGDGNPVSPAYQKFGRDVYGFSLGYHNNDYKPIGGSAANAFDKVFTAPSTPVGTTGNTGAQLFNGNISNTTVALNRINSGQTTGYSYLYDQLNRLLGMRQHSISGNSWNYSSFNTAYEEKFSYDANGNIKTLVRKGANITGMPLAMDNLKYFYYYTNTSNARAEYDPTVALPGNVKSLSNQLAHVTDTDPAGNYTEDIDNQTAGNYDYDNIGNLMKDNAEGITGVEWTVYGKIKQIKKGAVTINYAYDVSGNRISKEVIGAPGGTTKQFYIRDASGNTMAIYNGKTSYVEWSEQHLYGSSRLGIWNYGKQVPLLPVGVGYDSMMVGSFNYELTNHLGNVLSTISDKKVGVSVGGVLVDYYNAEVLNQNDYYAFGSLMPGRKYSVANTNYRYGFNGKENDNEIEGQQDYGFRIYDKRLGRFKSVDPLTKKYPWYTPYQFAGNKPIRYIDIDGLEEGEAENSFVYQTYQIKASITNNLIRLSPNREKNKLKEEFAKAGITDETFINNYQIRLRTIVTNHPADELNPQAWFEIDNKFVVESKNSFGMEMLEAAFDVLGTLSVVPSPGSSGFLAAKGGGHILISEFRRSMGILFNVKRLSVIGETRAALKGVQRLEDIMEAGKAFVGKNAREIRSTKGDLIGFESQDGLKRFRPPVSKKRRGEIQANFEQRINKEVKWDKPATETQRSNMHVVSDKEYKQ